MSPHARHKQFYYLFLFSVQCLLFIFLFYNYFFIIQIFIIDKAIVVEASIKNRKLLSLYIRYEKKTKNVYSNRKHIMLIKVTDGLYIAIYNKKGL